MSEHIAYVIADTRDEAHEIYRHWTLAGTEERRALEDWHIVFKGEADARYMLAKHLQAAKPGQMPDIWKLTIETSKLTVPPSSGIPPYKEGDIITVYDRPLGISYRAEVTECILAGATRPWLVSFESLKPIEPNESRHYVGSLEAHDNGTSPNITGGTE